MENFYVFAGYYYYPSGGVGDFIGKFQNLAECYKSLLDKNCDWWQIVDEDMNILEEKK